METAIIIARIASGMFAAGIVGVSIWRLRK
jgi:hypothetical protein